MELLEFPKFAIPLFFIVDIVMTYTFFKRYRQAFPDDKGWFKMEMNPIIRFLWQRLGLKMGTVLALIIVSPVVLVIILLASADKFIFGMVVGIYWMVFALHWKMRTEFFKELRRRRLKVEMRKLGNTNEGAEV